MRNQEVWALTLGDVAGRRASVREVLSYGALDAGKTEGATGPSRRPPIDALLADDLVAWKAALQAHVRERLAAYKVPKAIAFADALPRTPSGKLRRAELA